MVAAGHPHDQAVAASLRTAGIKRKGGPMAKHEGFKHPHGGDKPYGHESGMAGEHGMSPRKAMASGKIGGGNFGAESYDEVHGGTGHHPDHTAHTGMRDAMEDHERATPPGIHHTKGHLPAQAAPRHGPHMDGWDREPKA
jgi:hypothetical protein